MRYVKRPVIVVEATQWFKNGDHPNDNQYLVKPDEGSTSQFEPFLSEGKVVRYFRHPDVPGDSLCQKCDVRMHEHGWIDSAGGGQTVCPGDWIVTEPDGAVFPVKPSTFFVTYDEIGR